MTSTLAPTSELVQYCPSAALRPYVAWITGYRERGLAPGAHRGLPSPFLTLIVTLDDPLVIAAHPDPRQRPGLFDSLLGGLHTRPALITHPGRQSGIQLGLEPLGAYALLGVSARELASLDVPAEDVLGPLARELRERVVLARDWTERFALVDDVLLRRVDPTRLPPPEVAHAWRLLARSGGQLAMTDVADAVGWSTRHFADRFQHETGLAPKTAARVFRFDRARRALQRAVGRGQRPAFADLAARHGYYDQAHLAHDFRELAGCAPSQWVTEELRYFQDLVDVDESDWAHDRYADDPLARRVS